MTEFRQHPKYTWLWVTNNGDVWSAMRRMKKMHGYEDCGEPHKRLKARLHKLGYRTILTRYKDKVMNIRVCRLMADIWFPDVKMITHKDGNKANDRLSNLEPTNLSKNSLNMKPRASSGKQGLHWDSFNKRWSVNIMINRKNYRIGATTNEKRIPKIMAKREAIKKHYLKTGMVDLTVG